MRAGGRKRFDKAMLLAYTSPEGYHGPDSPRRESERERLAAEVASADGRGQQSDQPKPRTCQVDDCERPHRALGMCQRHYQQEHRRRELRGEFAPTPEQRRALDQVVAECRAAYAEMVKTLSGGGG